jgi:hypothetical protein
LWIYCIHVEYFQGYIIPSAAARQAGFIFFVRTKKTNQKKTATCLVRFADSLRSSGF